ncbi:hypothetical protein V8C37DRAFT_155202 [Trichoderma ceciliae]
MGLSRYVYGVFGEHIDLCISIQGCRRRRHRQYYALKGHLIIHAYYKSLFHSVLIEMDIKGGGVFLQIVYIYIYYIDIYTPYTYIISHQPYSTLLGQLLQPFR